MNQHPGAVGEQALRHRKPDAPAAADPGDDGDAAQSWRWPSAMKSYGCAGGGVLTASRRATCSAPSRQPTAPRLSSSCSTRRAPTIGAATPGRVSSQLIATCDGVRPLRRRPRGQPRRCASCAPRRAAPTSRPRSASASAIRVPEAGPAARSYLPVSMPCASGAHGISPMPSACAAGPISYSSRRSMSEYCGCSDTMRSEPPSPPPARRA